MNAHDTSTLPEIVCTYSDLSYITYILDEAKPYRVFEYKISSAGGCVYSTNHFPFRCEKLVTEFDWGNEVIQIPTLNETNFQEFLSKNMKNIFVCETDDYEYQHYFPSHCMISKSSRAEGKFARQY